MNTGNFFIFWTIIIAMFILIFYGGDRPFILLARISSIVAMILFILYFALGAQPRMWG